MRAEKGCYLSLFGGVVFPRSSSVIGMSAYAITTRRADSSAVSCDCSDDVFALFTASANVWSTFSAFRQCWHFSVLRFLYFAKIVRIHRKHRKQANSKKGKRMFAFFACFGKRKITFCLPCRGRGTHSSASQIRHRRWQNLHCPCHIQGDVPAWRA